MVYYRKRKSYKSYAKKGISKAAVKTMITKSTDWNYHMLNHYQAIDLKHYFVKSLTNPAWTETGKTILKQMKLNVFRKCAGLIRVIVFQSVDKFDDSNTTEPPQCAVELLTDTVSDELATMAQMYPDQNKYKILMDKLYYQGAPSGAEPYQIIRRTFNKLSPLTLSNNAANPEGHIYVLFITQAQLGELHISSTVKYSN